jgi:hypothetical protein
MDMRNALFILFILISLIFYMDSYSQQISKSELDEMIQKSGKVKTIQLKDKKGVYDENIEIHILNKTEQVAYSKVLQCGVMTEIDKDFIHFMKKAEIPNPYGKRLTDFLSKDANKTHYEAEMSKLLGGITISFNDQQKMQELIKENFKKIKKNKKDFTLPLIVFAGEEIRRRTQGKWAVTLNQMILAHEVVIIDPEGKKYYPFMIVSKFLEASVPEISFYIDSTVEY